MKNIPARQLALGSLLCLAAFGAQAQSNVKVYGLLDLGLSSSKDAATSTTPLVSQTKIDSGKMTTSFYGITGNEDLGGGLSAQFKLEGFLRADTGEQGRSTTDDQFARAAFVGLTHKELGSLNFGRNPTALFMTALNFNAFGNSFGYSPTIRHYFAPGQATVTGDISWKDSLSYSSPKFGGFSMGAAWAAKEDTASTAGNNWSISGAYNQGPWAAALVVQDVQKDSAAPVGDTRTTHISGSYDFDVAKVFLQYAQVEDKVTKLEADLTDLSVRVPMGKGAVIAAWGLKTPEHAANRKTVSAGYVYALSKQTDVYAVGMYDKVADFSKGYSYSAGMRVRF